MAERNFHELLKAQWEQKKFLSVALDPDIEKFPEHIRQPGIGDTLIAFNKVIVDATKDIVGAYKVNAAFYEAFGDQGLAVLQQTIEYIREVASELPIILDAKRADIGNTNNGYVRAAFDALRADAITVHPYLGAEALEPFLARKEKGIFVLCRTSNPGAGEFQDLQIEGKPLYVHVAREVEAKWNTNGNCGLVVGATYPEEMRAVREAAPSLTFLVPGIGAQGGDLEASVKAAKDAQGQGFIITVARAVLYASQGKEFATAAREKALEYDGAIRNSL